MSNDIVLKDSKGHQEVPLVWCFYACQGIIYCPWKIYYGRIFSKVKSKYNRINYFPERIMKDETDQCGYNYRKYQGNVY